MISRRRFLLGSGAVCAAGVVGAAPRAVAAPAVAPIPPTPIVFRGTPDQFAVDAERDRIWVAGSPLRVFDVASGKLVYQFPYAVWTLSLQDGLAYLARPGRVVTVDAGTFTGEQLFAQTVDDPRLLVWVGNRLRVLLGPDPDVDVNYRQIWRPYTVDGRLGPDADSPAVSTRYALTAVGAPGVLWQAASVDSQVSRAVTDGDRFLVTRVRGPIGDGARTLFAVAPDGSRFAANNDYDQLLEYDARTLASTGVEFAAPTIRLDAIVGFAAADGQGFAVLGGHRLGVYRFGRPRPVRTTSLDELGSGLAASPDGGTVYTLVGRGEAARIVAIPTGVTA